MREPSQNYWSELIIGMNFFNSKEMLQFIKECENIFSILENMNRERNDDWTYFNNGVVEEDPAIKSCIDELHVKFKNIAPRMIDLIGRYIRKNIDEFLIIYSG